VFFIGTDKRVYNFWWNPNKPGTKWQLDALDYNAKANAASNLVVNASGDHVFFIGTDERVYNFWWNPNKPGTQWQLDLLMSCTPQSGVRELIIDKFDRLFYVANDRRVYSFYWSSGL
jgi:hypothetical protein